MSLCFKKTNEHFFFFTIYQVNSESINHESNNLFVHEIIISFCSYLYLSLTQCANT